MSEKDMLSQIVKSQCVHFTMKEWKQAAARLQHLEAIEEAAWKLMEHPTSETALRELMRVMGLEP